MPRNRTLVVIGAGATYDSWGGLGVVHESHRPPLTAELFGPYTRDRPEASSVPRSQLFEEMLDEYPGAFVIAQDLAPAIANGAFSLEERLATYAHHKSSQTRRHYLDVPPYLRHMLLVTTSKYSRAPAPQIRLIQRLLLDTDHEVVFLVLNYDTLIETARTYVTGLQIRGFDDYVADERVRVVKLHGSVDWGVALGTNESRRRGEPRREHWRRLLDQSDVDTLRSAPIQYVGPGAERCWDWASATGDAPGTLYYPAITAPLARKDLNQAVCPPEHLSALRESLAGCTKVLILGCSGLDEDVLGLLSEIPSVDLFTVVTRETEATVGDTFLRFARNVPALKDSAAFDVHRYGLRYFTENTGLDSFALGRADEANLRAFTQEFVSRYGVHPGYARHGA